MISSPNIASNYSEAGVRKASLSAGKLLILGFFAGMFIALAGAASSIGSAMFENPSAAKLVSSVIFPAGLAMVVLTGSELFTGNSLMVISLLNKKIRLSGLVKNFVLVYLGNLLGSLFVSSIFVYSHTTDLFHAALAQNLLSTAAAKTSLSFSDAFLRAILCNVLVCIAVWMTMSAEHVSGKIAALYPPIMVFVLCGFEHCVANIFYIPAGLFIQAEYGLAAEGLTWISFFVKNLIPVTLGNLVGGMAVVGAGFWLLYQKDAAK